MHGESGDDWVYMIGYFMPVGSILLGHDHWITLEETSKEEEARQLVNYLNGGDGRPFRYNRESMIVEEDER
jgi:hypothetical protein